MLRPLREALRPIVLPMYWNRLSIRLAEMNDDAGVVGSAAFALANVADRNRTRIGH
mgnify:FL=1